MSKDNNGYNLSKYQGLLSEACAASTRVTLWKHDPLALDDVLEKAGDALNDEELSYLLFDCEFYTEGLQDGCSLYLFLDTIVLDVATGYPAQSDGKLFTLVLDIETSSSQAYWIWKVMARNFLTPTPAIYMGNISNYVIGVSVSLDSHCPGYFLRIWTDARIHLEPKVKNEIERYLEDLANHCNITIANCGINRRRFSEGLLSPLKI